MSSLKIISNIFKGIYKKTKKAFYNPYKEVGLNWTSMRFLKNLPEKKLQSIDLFNKKISFYSRDEFLHSLKEIFIEHIYNQKLRHNAYIIDCGANIGLSVIYMKRLFPEAKILAFEPDDLNFDLLQKNVAAFELKHVELRKEAVWVENTTLHFGSKGSLMSRIEDNVTSDTIEVKASRLKDFINEEVDFLKIDIEGAEYAVLKDIQEKLPLVQNLFLEYHGTYAQNAELNEMLQIVLSAGFKYYIKEAADKHPIPFLSKPTPDYDLQLNIFCFRK